MESETKYHCTKESQLRIYEADIAELKTGSDFNNQRIFSIEENMKDINKKLDSIKDELKNLYLKSIQEDSEICNRVTALENTLKVLQWVTAVAFSFMGVAIAFLAFLFSNFS